MIPCGFANQERVAPRNSIVVPESRQCFLDPFIVVCSCEDMEALVELGLLLLSNVVASTEDSSKCSSSSRLILSVEKYANFTSSMSLLLVLLLVKNDIFQAFGSK